MSRESKNPDYAGTLNATLTVREALPLHHLARFVVAIVTQLDLSPICARYVPVGSVAIAPEILLGLLDLKEVTGFRHFSLCGLLAVAGEWCLVCLAFNLKRWQSLQTD
jgi:hypothetical protein